MIVDEQGAYVESGQPSVALVIVNLDAREHLAACLDSVAELDYAQGLLETIVVDNGSTDGSLELLETKYPWVRVLPQGRNLGFAGGVNAGARTATAECVATCNNDMRLDRAWLTELVRTWDPGNGVACVSGLILDWTGERIDFADAYVTAIGMAGQPGFGELRENFEVKDGRVLPFACGGSMLVGRVLFLELGGFDEAFFALLEDVDFGWRLRLAGWDVRLAARAVSYHRHNATVATIPSAERLVMVERNALRMLLKNVGDKNLTRLLAPALALFVSRNDRNVQLRALAAVLEDVGAIGAERERVQRRRVCTDEEVFARFGRPFLPAAPDRRYLATSAALTRHFRLAELFPQRRAASLLIIGDDEERRTLARAAVPLARVVYVAAERVPIPGVESLGLDDPAPLATEVDVVIDRDADVDVEQLRQLVACPPRLGPTEDEQLLLAQLRRERGVGQRAHERVARMLWSAIPERLRRIARP